MTDTANTLPAIEILLFNQHRYAEAEKELRNFLSANPDNAYGHSLLAVALLNLDRNTESLTEAREAAHLSPNDPYCYYILSIVQMNTNNSLNAAESSIKKALELDPNSSASYYSTYSTILIKQQKFNDALTPVNKGLEIDPQHKDCLNRKALILLNIDRFKQAGEVIETALQNNPEGAETFRVKGWLAIKEKNYTLALESFRESLRIDPTNDLSKEGLVHALKMKSRIFRFFTFVNNLKNASGRTKFIALLVFVLFTIICFSFKTGPIIFSIMLSLIVILCPIIFYLNYAMPPLFNLALRFNRYGKFALTRGQIWDANFIASLLILSVLQLAASIITSGYYTPLGAIGTFMLVLPVSGVFAEVDEKHLFTLFVMLIILLSILAYCVVISFSKESPNIKAIALFFFVFCTGCVIFKFVSDKLK